MPLPPPRQGLHHLEKVPGLTLGVTLVKTGSLQAWATRRLLISEQQWPHPDAMQTSGWTISADTQSADWWVL